MNKWQLLNKQFVSVFFFGCAFPKTFSDFDQLYCKSQMEKQFYDFRKLKSKTESSDQYVFFFLSLSICIQEAE